MVSNLLVDAPLWKSEHAVITYLFNIHTIQGQGDTVIYKYNKTDWNKMNEMLNIEWKEEIPNLNVDEKWKQFKTF